MKPNNRINADTRLASDEVKCHRDTCRLRIVDDKTGEEECLMEYVRNKWTSPLAANYCKEPSALRFVEMIHST